MKKTWETAYKERGEIQTQINPFIKDAVSFIKKKNIKKVLDLGFGTGRHIIFLAENGFEVYGIDISETGKKITEEKIKQKNLKNIELKIGDMHNIPYPDDFFDAILAVYCLAHNTFADLKKTFSELKRVIKPNGILIGTLISINDPRYGTGKKIEYNTFIRLDDSEESDVPHKFSDKKEVLNLLDDFEIVKLEETQRYSTRRNMICFHWEFMAVKR